MTITAPPAPAPAPAPIVLEKRWTIQSLRPPQDAQSARIQAWTSLATFGWTGPASSAVAILDRLVRNASEHGQCSGEKIGVRIARTEAGDLLIDVIDRYTDFPLFKQAVAGHLGKGLGQIAQYGAVVSWHPHDHGKTVRAVVGGARS
ncbi:ATP-binding protein [Streptomyces bacillaris]|uniref:hypothetical protein n=1 Tax=Streptomyces bacillaris TaxID=68179 RepID=UPI0036F8492F